ncbi:MAG: tetratricopeptide repeat protein [Variovorax sp.]
MTRTERGCDTFTLGRVQAMLGLSRTVVDGLVAQGFVAPLRGKRNERRFTFQDLLLLRTAHALQTSNIPPRKILRALTRLRASLPQQLPLTGLRITAVDGDVVVRERDAHWQAESGQLLMDFEIASQSNGSVALLERSPVAAPAREHDVSALADADAWLARGEALEAEDMQGAQSAYEQALALAPELTQAFLNLGVMACEAGRYDEALELSKRAVAHCPDSALVHFNRGVALDCLERIEAAIDSYERALKLDATLADAHYNLARLRERLGDTRGALRHFSAYRRLQK